MANAQAYLHNRTGYLTHYTPYYVIGPLIGASLAGLFHLTHKGVLLGEDEDDESERDRQSGKDFSPDHQERLIHDKNGKGPGKFNQDSDDNESKSESNSGRGRDYDDDSGHRAKVGH